MIAIHKRFRTLLHAGDSVRFDTEPAYVAHGVYSPDRGEALVSWAVVATAPSLTPPPLRLPGLRAGPGIASSSSTCRAMTTLPPASSPHGVLAVRSSRVGNSRRSALQPPSLNPESAILIHLAAVES